jgi:hypothetical protein
MSKRPQVAIKPEAAPTPAVDLAKRQDQAVEREVIMWASYWLARYLSVDWEAACVGWAVHLRPRRKLDYQGDVLSGGFRRAVERIRAEVAPDAAWIRPVVERLRAKAGKTMLGAWYEKGGQKYASQAPKNQIEELATRWADHMAREGIIPTRESLRGDRALARARPVAARPAPIDEARRWAAAEATAEAMV